MRGIVESTTSNEYKMRWRRMRKKRYLTEGFYAVSFLHPPSHSAHLDIFPEQAIWFKWKNRGNGDGMAQRSRYGKSEEALR